jgi:small-conductance mechanosensitive channel
MHTFARLALCIAMFMPWLATAQSPQGATAQPTATTDTDVPGAPVRLDGEILFNVRGSPSTPAAERAAVIAGRIRQAADDDSVAPDDVRVVPVESGWQIMAGTIRVMTVLPGDSEFESTPSQMLAPLHAGKVREAIKQYRAIRTPERLVRGVLVSVAATALLAALWWLFHLGFTRLEALFARHFRARIEALPASGGHGGRFSLWGPMESGVHATRWLLRVALIFVWLEVVFAQFPWTRWVSANLARFFVDPVVQIGQAFADYLPNLFFLLVLFFVTRYGLRLLKVYFAAVDRGSTQLPRFDREWSWPTYKIIRAGVLGLALIMAYPYLPGSGTDALKGVSVFVGLLISLGASSAVSGIIAGYVNTFGRVFKVGDLIKVGEVMGVVTEVRLMTTRVRTIRNEEVTIPNATITASSLVNFSALARERGLVLQTEVGIGYEVPWRQVHAMLLEAAARTPDLLAEPAPFVIQKRLGDFAVVYQLNVHKGTADGLMRSYSALHQNILDVFNEHGVQIMTPAYEGDPDAPKVVPKDQWFASPARPPARGNTGQP